MGRLATGIEGFDAMVGGGLPEGAGIVLQGPAGSEKLLFALTFLAEGLRSGGSGLFVIASQTAESILSELRSLGVDLDAVAKENRLRIVDWYSWSEETITDVEERGIILRSSNDLANLGAAMSRAIAALPSGASKRAVIEMLSPALNVYELTQVYAFAQSTKRKFDRFGFTSIFVVEKDMHQPAVLSTLAQPFDGVVEIERTRSGDRIIRKIGVLHMRDTAADTAFLPLEITGHGFRVGSPARAPTVPTASRPPQRVATSPLVSPEESPADRKRRTDLIMQIARERLHANPSDADAWFATAAGLATMGDIRGSLDALGRLADLDPAYPGLWVLKAKLHARLGEEEEWRQARMKADQYEAPSVASDLVPCPVCGKPLAKDASLCPHCGSRTETETDIIEELESLVKETLSDLGPEKAAEAPPEEVAADVESQLAELAGLVAEATPAAPPQEVVIRERRQEARKGLTNGLRLGRFRARGRAVQDGGQGRTNGLTNGLRGRTNGLTNGLGRTNGLTNGLRGRTNGLTNGLRGRTNGLTNGLGRTNGLTNGLGRTNGLTNGLGGARQSKNLTGLARFQRKMARSPWTRYGVPIAVIALLIVPLFFLWVVPTRNYPITIDGQFGDWAGVAKMDTQVPAAVPNPDIELTRVAVKDNLDYLSFYLEVRGNVLAGQPDPGRITNAFFAFIDADRSRATGYQVQGIGADRLVTIETWGGQMVGAGLKDFDPSHGPRDWNGWIASASVQAAGSGSQLEFQVPWSYLLRSSGPVDVAFASRSWDGQTDAADLVATDASPYVVLSQDSHAPTVLSPLAPDLSRFTFHAVGGDVSITSVNVSFRGTFQPSTLSAVDLVDETGGVLAERVPAPAVSFNLAPLVVPSGGNRTLSVRPRVASADGSTLGAFIENLEDVVVASGGVAFVGPARSPDSLAYVGAIPNAPVVDGGFSDWPNVTADPAGDVQPIWNPDLDLSGYAFRGSAGNAFFMAQLVGTALNGTMVPAGNPTYTPPANGTGNGTVNPPPPPENGTDLIRIFLDVDGSSLTGYSIGGMGADFLIEIAGKEGLVLSNQALQFTGSVPSAWSWRVIGSAPAAKDRSRIEAALPGVAITNVSRAYFTTSGWGGSHDDTSPAAPFATLSGPFLMQTLSMNQVSTLSLSPVSSGIGTAAGDQYGFNVSGVGRINAASGAYESFVIGAPSAAGGKGAIHVFFGYAGWSPANINAASANVTITGQTAGDHFGWSVAGAGDVNGDGMMDFLVGAPDAGTGKAYLIYGRTSWTGVTNSSINTVASVVAITGQNIGDKFGSSVAGLANVNNAGNADIAVGAYAYASSKGRVYVFYDNSTMPTSASQASLFLDGSAAGDKFGFSIAGAGNVNGDSYADFAVGAPGANKAYVYTLGINPVTNGFLTANANGWTFGKVDPNGFDTGAWDNTGGSTPDSSGAGSYKFTFADTSSSLTLYFHNEAVADNTLSGKALLPVSPDLGAAASSMVTATGDGQRLILGNWTTPALGTTAISAGTWTFSYDTSTGNGIAAANLDVHIYKLSSTGTLTAIDGTSGLDSTAGVAATATITNPATYTGTYSMAAASIATTDAVYIRVYANVVTVKIGTKTVTFNYDASTASSNVVTTAAFPELRYFHAETASVNGFTDPQLLTTGPDRPGNSPGSVSFTASATGHFFLGEFTFPQMAITSIPAGDWNFYYWGTSQAAEAHFDVHVYTRSASGALTSVDGTNGLNATVGVASSGTITASGSAGLFSGSVQLGSISLATTDAIVVRVYVNIVTFGTGNNKATSFNYDTTGVNSRLVYPGKTYTDRLYLVSTAGFTSPPGSYTNVRYRFSYTSTVTSLGNAYYKVKYQIRDSGDTATVATAYDSGSLTAAQAWALQTGTFTGLSASTGYKIRVMLEVYDINQGQTPSITVNVDDIDLQFETITNLMGTAGTNFGWAVAMVASGTGLTTFNNDNLADVAVGAPSATNGQVTIYYGNVNFGASAAVTITGAASGDKFGYSVSSAADFNGDGIADILIGAPFHAGGGTASGAVYVFTGSSSPASSMTTSNAYNSGLGENANDHYGWSVSYSHPNGAATSFILVGAPNFSVPNANEGKAYVLAIPEFGDLLTPIAGVVFMVLALGRRYRRRRNTVP